MSLTGFAITLYKKSPLYPKWGRFLAKSLVTVSKLSGVPLVRAKPLQYGFTMNIDREQAIDTKILHARFEPESVELIERLVQPGWSCCDVGANIGFLSLLMAKKVGPSGMVYAFEVSDWAFDRLVSNIQLNEFSWIQPIRAAVGAESQPQVEMCVPCGYRLDCKDTATTQQMPMIALDDYFADGKKLDFLKIDTDGYEPYVFKGAMKTIERLRPIIFFELCPDGLKRAGSSTHELITFVTKLGYRFENEMGQPLDPIAEAEKIYENGSINVVAIPS